MFAKCLHIFQNKTYWKVHNSLEPAAVCIVFQIYYCSRFVYLSVETPGLQCIVVLLQYVYFIVKLLYFKLPPAFYGDHSGVVYTCIASHSWIKGSRLSSHSSQCNILYAYTLCIEMNRRKLKIVRVVLSKDQVHFSLVSMSLSSCLSFNLSPHISSHLFYSSLKKVTISWIQKTWNHSDDTWPHVLAFYSTQSEINNFLQIFYIYSSSSIFFFRFSFVKT